jgi:TolB-like protein
MTMGRFSLCTKPAHSNFTGVHMHLRPILLSIILFSLNLLAAGISSQTKTNIAVSDLAGQGIDASNAAVITDRLRSELFNTGTITVLERSQMQDILKEQGFQQAGCTTDQCAVETGQMLGVKYMVVGSIGLVGHTYTIASRLIDVSTGKMVATANVDCRCEIDDVLSRSTVEIARKLAQSFSNAQNNESPKPAATAPPKPPATETGSMKISSTPAGASLFVNDSAKGTTPANIDSLKSGWYRLRLELKGYSSFTDNVRVGAGGTEEKNYTLKTLPVSEQQGEKKKHSKGWPKIALGAGAIVAAGAGFLCDNLVKTETNKCTDISALYNSSGSNAAYATSRQDYIGHYNKAKNYSLYRNVLYGAAGVLAAGFAISLAF